MRVSANWLAEYVGDLPAKDIAAKLEQVGVEVEQVIYTPKLDKAIVVADVKKVIQHPNADKLKIAELSFGQAKTSVVCGGPNLAAGQKVALVQPGVVLPDGSKIEKVILRGVESNGMIASSAELGLSDDHSGILVLEPSAKVGTAVAEIYPEEGILDLKTAANRPDLMSIVGLAREAAAAGNHKLKEPLIHEVTGKGNEPKVKVEKSTKTRRYMAIELEADPRQPSPEWMQRRLMASGIRPINIVVDITNYVMLEYGQPLHAFDAAKVKGSIVVRHSKSGEKLATLDGQNRKLMAEDVVIADSKGAIALAGVMGGAGSEITESTKRIILESASFDAPSVRRTALRHACRTDSSARFERNLPVQLAPVGLARAVDFLQKYAKGKVVSSAADELLVWPWVQHVGVRARKVSQLLGFELSREEIAKTLRRLGISAEPFDIVTEAKKHLGKPYKWGASFKTDGTDAFDCSYLTDYIYSLIGLWIGHTAAEQFENGWAVHTGELRPGDILFRNGPWEKLDEKERHGIAHDYMFIGGDKVIEARNYERNDKGKWIESRKRGVVMESAQTALSDPDYKGARRYVENLDDFVAVTAPWWRPDLKTEEDLIEEIGRLVGYDRVPATLPTWRPAKVEFNQYWPKVWRAQSALKGLGLFEVVTYSFVSSDDITNCGLKLKDHLKLKNPMSVEQAYLRTTLLPSLLTAASKNQAQRKDFTLFELAKVYLPTAPGKLPNEPKKLGLIAKGENPYLKVKAALEALEHEFGVEVSIDKAAIPQLHPARAAKLSLGDKELGVIGEVHPDITSRFKLKSPAAFLEIDVETLFELVQPPHYQPVSRFPSVWRDLAIVVNQKVTWQDVRRAVDAKLAKASFLSEFSGEGLPAGKKSLAVRLEMSDPAKTLTDAEASQRVEAIVSTFKAKFKAEIR